MTDLGLTLSASRVSHARARCLTPKNVALLALLAPKQVALLALSAQKKVALLAPGPEKRASNRLIISRGASSATFF